MTTLVSGIKKLNRDGSVALLYLGLALFFYAPLVVGWRTFPDGDFTHHFLPFSLLQQAALRAGELPLWNPYTYSGHPFLADTQAAVFYPLSNLGLLLTWPWTSPGARLYFLQWEALIHVALAGYFVDRLVRELTGSRWAALIGGCSFAFSGYLTGYPPLQLAVLRTAIWLPLILWLLHRAFGEPQRGRWWIGAALAYATAFLAGHPQTFLHITYVVGGYGGWLLVANLRGQQAAARRSTVYGSLLFVALTLALSAAQLLPSLEFAQLSVRANVDYDFVSGGFPLPDTWQVLLPGVLTQFSPLYIGVVGVGFALLGIGSAVFNIGHKQQTSPQSHLWFFLALTLLALLLAYGRNAFLYPLFYQFAPGWNLFRGQERAAFLVALGLSVLAGYGAAAVPTLPLLTRQRWALLFIALVAAGVYGFGLFWQLLGHSAISQGHYLLIALFTLSLAAAWTVALRLPGWGPRRQVGLPALLILNLFVVNLPTNVAQFGPARKTILAPEMAAIGAAQQADPAGANQAGLPPRVYNEFRVYEDYGMRQQLEDVWGSSPLRLARYARLFDNFPLDRLWQLTGVRHLLTWRRELFAPDQSELLAEFPQQNDTTYLHRLTAANPRAWAAHQVWPTDDERALKLLADHSINLAEVALLAPEHAAQPVTYPPGALTLNVQRLANNRLQVEVKTASPTFLVISENWLPGWQVVKAVCGSARQACPTAPTPASGLATFTPYRTNLSFLGVAVPAGDSRFELLYWPNSVRNGLLISGSTLLLLVILGLLQLIPLVVANALNFSPVRPGKFKTLQSTMGIRRRRQPPAL